jgi:hypothetical protein
MFKTAFQKFGEEPDAAPAIKPGAKTDPADPLEKEGHVKAAFDHLSQVVSPDDESAEISPDDEVKEGEKLAAIEGTSRGGKSKGGFTTRHAGRK